VRVLIVDDHEVVRRGVRSLLASQTDLDICGEAVDGRDAIAKALELRPDVITMDISMPNLNGLEATREIRRILPDTPVLIMSQHDVPEMMKQALDAGATAYIVKSAISTQLITALDRVRHPEPAPGLVFGSAQANADAEEVLRRSAELESALRESEERFRLTFEHAGVGMAHVAASGAWLRMNRKLCDIVGYSESELCNMKFQDITHPDDLPVDLAQSERVIKGELDDFAIEKRYIRKDGSIVWVNLTVAARRDAKGQFMHYVTVVEDITARKHAEEQLLQAKQDLQITAANLASEAEALDKLNVCSSRLWRMDNLQDGLTEMLNAVIELVEADKGNIQLLDPRKRVLTIAAQHGFQQDFLDFYREVSADDPTACGRSLRDGSRIIVEDVETDSFFATLREVARAAGYRAVISTPLIGSDGEPLGVISTHFSKPHRPSPESLRRLDLYVRQAADFIQRCRTESALRQSEEHFRAIVDTTPECVKVISQDGTILHINASGVKMLGTEAAESTIGKDFYEMIAPHDREKYRVFNERICAGERGALDYDIINLRSGIRHMETHAAPFRQPDGTLVHLAVTRDVTHRREAEEALKEAEFSGRLLRLQDEERRRIARELHDGAGQLLAAMSMNTSKISREQEKLSGTAGNALRENAELIERISTEIRNLSRLLHPPLLDEVGLRSALNEYVAGFSSRSNIRVNLEMPANWQPLPRDYELSVFRIVQECLTNVHRHSGSPTALVRLMPTQTEIILEVTDQGHGMELEVQQKFSHGASAGVGLRGMRERVRQLGGSLEINSRPDGTTVLAVLPLGENVQSAP
jgi:PAS domain S-box-containing protein